MPRNLFLLFLTGLLIILGNSAFTQQSDTTSSNSPAKSNFDNAAALKKATANKILVDSIRKYRDSSQVLFFYSDFEKLGKLNLHQNDTSLSGIQIYDLLYKHDKFYTTPGNIGQSSLHLLPIQQFRTSGFDYGIHSLDPYLYQNDSVKYYKVYKTYTELQYVQGAKKEQNFHAVFSRNIYRTLNLGFDFHVMSAPGAYSRQKTNHINFVLTTQYFSKNRRYGVIANFTLNRLKNYENGGIKYDSLFESNLETNRAVIPVNLSYAQNRVRETCFFMKHYFDLTRHIRDPQDTTASSTHKIELGRLSYSFQYTRQIQNFMDTRADSGFFPPPVLDTVKTFDSLTVKQLTNEVIWSNPSFKPDLSPRVFQIEVGLKQQYSEVVMAGAKNFFQQFVPHARIIFTPFSSLSLDARGDYVIGDYNENDFSLRVKLSFILGSRKRNAGIISLYGDYILQKPGWFFTQYPGNNYNWDTTWLKKGYISGGFKYAYKFLETGFNLARITNYTYLDTLSLPAQFTSQFGYFNLYLNADLDLWRFKIRPQLVYQSVQGTTVLRLPAFMGNLAIYYSQQLFHGAATLQPGLNFYYNTAYFADNYNPATRSFFLQDKKEIGNYLYMDVFINLKIQRARFFFTYTHFNASLMSHTYYTIPGYPMQDGAFKFGVAWRFHD